jgi:hypothetical protein
MGCSIGGRATPGAGERIRPRPASAEDQAPWLSLLLRFWSMLLAAKASLLDLKDCRNGE